MAKKKILIVEDDRDQAFTLGTMVGEFGYVHKIAYNAKEAFALIKKEKFDLVILDVMLPGQSGLDIAAWIKAEPKLEEYKIVFLTVVPKSEVGIKLIKEIDPVAYLKKPYDVKKIKTTLKKALA